MSGTAQPTQAEGAQPSTPAAQPQPENSGVQKRIDQLVGQFHEVKGQLDTVTGMNQQLLEANARLEQELARVRSQPSELALPPLPEGADPGIVDAIVRRIEASQERRISQLEKQLTQAVSGTAAQTELLTLQQALAAEPATVQQQAMALYNEVKQKNYTGWTPQNLVWMARGRVAVTQPVAPIAPPMMPGGGVPSPVVPPSPPAKSEAELRAMSYEQRMAYYESRIGDSEIQY